MAGNPLEVWGSAVVDIEIAGKKFRSPVVVTSALTAEAILGSDFLRLHPEDRETTTTICQPLSGTSTEAVIIQARVTLGETSCSQ